EHEAVELALGLARAIGRAHERGIVHRDLKPGNVLFADDGRPLIADLGIAKRFARRSLGASQTRALTAMDEGLGTPEYMAPEQQHDARAVGPPADVYSLGAIFYECLTGELWKSVPRRATVTGPLARIIERCLSVDPTRRFEDGHALARAIEGVTKAP